MKLQEKKNYETRETRRSFGSNRSDQFRWWFGGNSYAILSDHVSSSTIEWIWMRWIVQTMHVIAQYWLMTRGTRLARVFRGTFQRSFVEPFVGIGKSDGLMRWHLFLVIEGDFSQSDGTFCTTTYGLRRFYESKNHLILFCMTCDIVTTYATINNRLTSDNKNWIWCQQ